MAHATQDPRSFGSQDGNTVPSKAPSKQAATREAEIDAYVARVVSEAPKRSDEFLDRIAVLLRPPAERTNAAPGISIDQYRYWENRRYLDSETPGKFGFFGAGEAA